MQNLNNMEQRSLVDELTQGRELANQLKNQIGPLLTSKETCEHLLQKILSSYDKALACLNLTELLQRGNSPIVSLVDSPESSNGASPKIGFPRIQSTKNVFKKRKTMPRWSEQIRVSSGAGLEGLPADGHSWRKYGQKDILGATHPRAYYRCTHKYTRACGATKQVQKTEDDPLVFEVTYRGSHTCMDVPNAPSPVCSLEEKPKNAITNLQQQLEPKQNQKQDILFNFEQGLKVETEEINTKMVGRIPSFPFPSSSIQSENQDIWDQFEENNILAGLESPSTTESNYFSGVTDQVLTYPYDHLSDMISTPTSGLNSVFHFDMDPIEFNVEPNVPFNVLDYIATDMIY